MSDSDLLMVYVIVRWTIGTVLIGVGVTIAAGFGWGLAAVGVCVIRWRKS